MDAAIVRKVQKAKGSLEDQRLSKDGHWRSFAKVPNLLQYVPNATYYARTKRSGKIIRRSLETTSFSTAKLRLLDFLKAHHAENQLKRASLPSLTFDEARNLYLRWLESDLSLKPKSRDYRHLCLKKVSASWPDLGPRPVDSIMPQECRDWAAGLRLSSHYFNNVVGTARQIFELALREHRQTGRSIFENPILGISRVKVLQKQLTLPESDQFRGLLREVRSGSSGWGRRAADLIEFLALSGMRAFSEAFWVTWADVDWAHNEFIVRGDPSTGTKNGELRRVPILPDMATLLGRLKETAGSPAPSSRVLEVKECQGALDRACKVLGLRRITHHDLRHLFATRCIEAGVDIPTVARWMGHKDGGALALRTYGHLRNEHSQAMAKKVRF